jgi:hypothetical protein
MRERANLRGDANAGKEEDSEASKPAPTESVINAPIPSSPPAPQRATTTLPVKKLRNPAPTPVQPSLTTDIQTDHAILNAPSTPKKLSRKHDEEVDDVERAAKQTNIEDTTSGQDFKAPELPQASTLQKDGSELSTQCRAENDE